MANTLRATPTLVTGRGEVGALEWSFWRAESSAAISQQLHSWFVPAQNRKRPGPQLSTMSTAWLSQQQLRLPGPGGPLTPPLRCSAPNTGVLSPLAPRHPFRVPAAAVRLRPASLTLNP
ncbi:hypothetical protein QTO34_008640 [Cnephaeus nilssonii]|uniref:Uncharacterized protein n=1 Tax=Cnephaeus nilssonii TaxID=3371016 RepID=A0AA40HH34_CNENI|nr:hypothetical protein QTO34_008640 [Eptesicus nilssonii]